MANRGANTIATPTKAIATIIIAAFALRVLMPLFALAVARPEPQFREPDSAGYLAVANEWLETGWYAVRGEPEIVRTPGYPLFLLPGITAGQVELITIGLQIVLGCITVWLVHRTALLTFGTGPVAITAAWLCACEPISIIYASKLLSETLFTTVIMAAICSLARFAISSRWRDLVAAAVTIAAAAYVRPIAYWLPAWIGLAIIVADWLGRVAGPYRPEAPVRNDHGDASLTLRVGVRRRLLQVMAFVALTVCLLIPWQIRNWREAGYAGFSAISDINLYYYEAFPIAAEQQGIEPVQRDAARIAAGEGDLAAYLREHPEQANWSPANRYRFLRQEAISIIRAHPLDWIRIHFTGVFHTLTDSGRNAWLGYFRVADTHRPAEAAPSRTFWQRLCTAATERPLVLAIHALLAAVLCVYLSLALAGIITVPRTFAVYLVLAVAVYLLLVSGGDAGYHRFRLPLTPIICLFAAQGYFKVMLFVRKSDPLD